MVEVEEVEVVDEAEEMRKVEVEVEEVKEEEWNCQSNRIWRR